MTRNIFAIPVAAALVLSLSACGRDDPDRDGSPSNVQLPQKSARTDAADKSTYDPNYKDPSIPENPAHKGKEMKDTSPPNGTGDPAVRQ